MFKIFKNTAVCVLLAAIMLTGCSTSVKDSVENVAAENNWFYRISDTPMVYDKDTHVMYYLFSKYFGNQGYGYMSPYYNEHGQMCYYVDGQIIPVEEVLIDVDLDCLAHDQSLYHFDFLRSGNSLRADSV